MHLDDIVQILQLVGSLLMSFGLLIEFLFMK
jgi:hypothetical protein